MSVAVSMNEDTAVRSMNVLEILVLLNAEYVWDLQEHLMAASSVGGSSAVCLPQWSINMKEIRDLFMFLKSPHSNVKFHALIPWKLNSTYLDDEAPNSKFYEPEWLPGFGALERSHRHAARKARDSAACDRHHRRWQKVVAARATTRHSHVPS